MWNPGTGIPSAPQHPEQEWQQEWQQEVSREEAWQESPPGGTRHEDPWRLEQWDEQRRAEQGWGGGQQEWEEQAGREQAPARAAEQRHEAATAGVHGARLPLAHEAPHQIALREALAAGADDPDHLTRIALRSAAMAGETLHDADGTSVPEDFTRVRDTIVMPLLARAAATRRAAVSGPLWVPGAERVANPRSAGGTYVTSSWRFVVHTVEAEDTVERFRARAAAHPNPPHLWAMPSADLLLQTVPLDRSAYALARPAALHTNRLHAVQVELWGFAATMGEASPETLEWLARRVLAPVARLVPLHLGRVLPTAGITAYGAGSHTRMTPQQWQVFDGVCGHQHVPDNRHWDPGRLDLAAIAERARVHLGSGPGVAGGAKEDFSSDHDGEDFAAEDATGDPAEDGAGDQARAPGALLEQLTPPPATPPAGTLPSSAVPAPAAAPSAGPAAPPSPPVPPLRSPYPILRGCCMLHASALRGRPMVGVGPYLDYGGYGSGSPGIVFTGAAGFVDLGHLYAVVDVTAYAYQQIHAARGASGTPVVTAEGAATLTSAAPPAEWLELARSIAYDDALTHEIFSYAAINAPTMHNSAFSPEDLCSNHLGTVVAARALQTGGPFPKAAEEHCRNLLTSLNVQNPIEAKHAFNMIAQLWVDAASGIGSPRFLRRRNFSRTPWRVARHPAGGTLPAGLLDPFVLTSTYTFRHATGFTNADFPARIAAIRQHAAAAYGPRYDQPT